MQRAGIDGVEMPSTVVMALVLGGLTTMGTVAFADDGDQEEGAGADGDVHRRGLAVNNSIFELVGLL